MLTSLSISVINNSLTQPGTSGIYTETEDKRAASAGDDSLVIQSSTYK